MTPKIPSNGNSQSLTRVADRSVSVQPAARGNRGSVEDLSAKGRALIAGAGAVARGFLTGVWKYEYQSIPTEIIEKPANPIVKEMALAQPLVDFINRDGGGRSSYQVKDCRFTVGRRQTTKGGEWFVAVATLDGQKFEFELNMDQGTLSLRKTVSLPNGVNLQSKELVPGIELATCQLTYIEREIFLSGWDVPETPSECR